MLFKKLHSFKKRQCLKSRVVNKIIAEVPSDHGPGLGVSSFTVKWFGDEKIKLHFTESGKILTPHNNCAHTLRVCTGYHPSSLFYQGRGMRAFFETVVLETCAFKTLRDYLESRTLSKMMPTTKNISKTTDDENTTLTISNWEVNTNVFGTDQRSFWNLNWIFRFLRIIRSQFNVFKFTSGIFLQLDHPTILRRV